MLTCKIKLKLNALKQLGIFLFACGKNTQIQKPFKPVINDNISPMPHLQRVQLTYDWQINLAYY